MPKKREVKHRSNIFTLLVLVLFRKFIHGFFKILPSCPEFKKMINPSNFFQEDIASQSKISMQVGYSSFEHDLNVPLVFIFKIFNDTIAF